MQRDEKSRIYSAGLTATVRLMPQSPVVKVAQEANEHQTERETSTRDGKILKNEKKLASLQLGGIDENRLWI